MILQKLSSAIRRQDWFQVVIEVMIVIVGIFLGLQVQEWYEDQSLRQQEQIYLVQLHEEVISAVAVAERRYLSASQENEMLLLLTNHFAGKTTINALTNEHCQAIARSHRLDNIVITIPTISEIINSGQLVIIRDQKLKSAISSYTLDNERNASNATNARQDIKWLGSLFPELIKLAPLETLETYIEPIRVHNCDFEAMKNNSFFQNELISNSVRQNSLTRNRPQQIELLNDLHSEIDRLLGINHPSEIP